jgi:hypothetical protein
MPAIRRCSSGLPRGFPIMPVILVLFWMAGCFSMHAQIANVTDVESVPIPGAGRDYVGFLQETVNPANGSLSVRIAVPIPEGRKLTTPFSFAYDSDGAIPINQFGGLPPYYQLGWSTRSQC